MEVQRRRVCVFKWCACVGVCVVHAVSACVGVCVPYRRDVCAVVSSLCACVFSVSLALVLVSPSHPVQTSMPHTRLQVQREPLLHTIHRTVVLRITVAAEQAGLTNRPMSPAQGKNEVAPKLAIVHHAVARNYVGQPTDGPSALEPRLSVSGESLVTLHVTKEAVRWRELSRRYRKVQKETPRSPSIPVRTVQPICSRSTVRLQLASDVVDRTCSERDSLVSCSTDTARAAVSVPRCWAQHGGLSVQGKQTFIPPNSGPRVLPASPAGARRTRAVVVGVGC